MLRLVLLTAMAALAGGMETRETVERMVMVRTTGSDLQPAATGYIYKKHDDGPESVVQMGESEVMEHLSKLYTRPTHGAPGNPDAKKAHADERVVPVTETHEEHIDGIADVDYKTIFDDSGHHRSYDDYLNYLKRFKGGLSRKLVGDSAEDDEESKNHKHGKGDAKSYHDEKFESYSISRGHKKDQDDGDAHLNAHKKHYDHYPGSKKDGQYARSFHGGYDNDKDDHEYFGKGGKAFAGEHKHYGTSDRAHKYHTYEPKHYAAKVEIGEDQGAKSAERADSHSSEASTASDDTAGDVGPQAGQPGGSSYGYQVEH